MPFVPVYFAILMHSQGEQVPQTHSIAYEGRYCVWDDGPGPYKIEEVVYYSDTTSEDNLAATPENGKHYLLILQPHRPLQSTNILAEIYVYRPLTLSIKRENCDRFPREKKARANRWYWDVDFQVRFTLEGVVMKCELVVARKGRFVNGRRATLLREETTINLGGAFPIGEA